MTSRTGRIKLTRRAALAGLGASGAAALLRPLLARAQLGTSPQRLLLIHRPCGTLADKWWPTGGVKDWVTSPILSPFEKLRSDMVVMKGVDCPRNQNWLGNKNGAGMIAMMAPPPMDKGPSDYHVWPVLPGFSSQAQEDTNASFFTSPDKTIDQLFLEKIPALRGTPIPSMQLTSSLESAAAMLECCARVVSYAKPDPAAELTTPLWPEVRPDVVFKNLFGLGLPMSPTDTASQMLDKSLLDFVASDLNRLKPRLPSSQVPKIDAHLAALRSLEQSIGNGARACMPPTLGPLPVPPAGVPLLDGQYLETCKQHMQLIRAAFQCDLTRVISFTYAYGTSGIHFRNVLPPGAITNSEGHYGIANGGGGNSWPQALEAIETFYAEMTASLLLEMKNTPDGAGPGSLLDNTLVVYWNNCSNGNSKDTRDIPVLLFGGKFLGLQGGSYLQFPQRYMSDFWVATAQRWGYEEMTSYGAPMWNTGPMPGIYG
jgi:Protein of unknown function (DUF1552)